MGSMPNAPDTQTAVVTTSDGSLTFTTSSPLPTLTRTSVLVHAHAVALNPSDYKMPARLRIPHLVSGADFAGVIVALGADVNSELHPIRLPWAIGDRVCGTVHGCNALRPLGGAYAEYIDADPVVLLHMPEHWSYAQGAALSGCCTGAVGLALYKEMGFAWPSEFRVEKLDAEREHNKNPGDSSINHDDLKKLVLVYGASTACGTVALQLLRLSGYIPIATCSPHNNELVKSFGAAAIFDYRSASCAADIKSATKNSLKFALDCIGTLQSTTICYAAIGRAGGRYVSLEKYPSSAASRQVVAGSWVMMTDMFGQRTELKNYSSEADPAAREFAIRFFTWIQDIVNAEKFKHHPIRLLNNHQGWLSAVLDGIELLKGGKISGEKLAVMIRE